VSPSDLLQGLDNFAGLAALINGLILWPVVQSLKREQVNIRAMLTKALAPKKRRRRKKT
jgi:hypothetical protein